MPFIALPSECPHGVFDGCDDAAFDTACGRNDVAHIPNQKQLSRVGLLVHDPAEGASLKVTDDQTVALVISVYRAASVRCFRSSSAARTELSVREITGPRNSFPLKPVSPSCREPLTVNR